ncbi:MAG: DNA mismatch repair protein MutS [Acidobacteriota bacterium]
MTDVEVRREYSQRLAARTSWLEKESTRSRRMWLWRRIVFVSGAAMILAALDGLFSFWWIALPVFTFIVLMVVHERINEARQTATRAVDFYQRGLARLSDAWTGTGETGERFADKNHAYSEDLDLFGRGSLFELISAARTRAGEERLAQWLLAPAKVDEIRDRQAAVAELRPQLDLREDLALLGASVRVGVDGDSLIAWASAPPIHFSRFLRVTAAILGIAAAASIIGWLVFDTRAIALVALVCEAVFLLFTRAGLSRVMSDIERPSRDLRLLGSILARLEREIFSSKKLLSLRAALDADGVPPSRQIARLYLLLDLLNSTKSFLFAPFAFILLLPAQLCFAIEQWRQVSGRAVIRWIEAIGDFEALASFAGYAAEHPTDPFPELSETERCYEGVGLAHPLIPRARAVPNDMTLGDKPQVLIVSGSNMSGKSTLLRTVGINSVLAFAGAPVRASELRLSPLTIGASIHILDSLQEGSSRFYAEITRLRSVVEMSKGELPLLFLLDEIMSGTNSHDRQIGAAAVVNGLVRRGAIGLITTHDLALTRIADELGTRATNVHFEDHLENGRMVFDYHMRSGVVTKSNALELMRAVGLDV